MPSTNHSRAFVLSCNLPQHLHRASCIAQEAYRPLHFVRCFFRWHVVRCFVSVACCPLHGVRCTLHCTRRTVSCSRALPCSRLLHCRAPLPRSLQPAAAARCTALVHWWSAHCSGSSQLCTADGLRLTVASDSRRTAPYQFAAPHRALAALDGNLVAASVRRRNRFDGSVGAAHGGECSAVQCSAPQRVATAAVTAAVGRMLVASECATVPAAAVISQSMR